MAVSIRDVAKAAGVSISTVSKVIHDAPTISEKTKNRVKKVMEDLSYYPNIIARSFAQQSSYTIGLIMSLQREDAFLNPYIYEILGGIEEVAQKYGYSLSLINMNTVLKNPNELERLMVQKRVDGLLVHLAGFTPELNAIIERNSFPCVFIGKPQIKSPCLYVDIDNIKAGELATRHLISKGAKRIAFMGQNIRASLTNMRFSGYQKALKDHGLPFVEQYVSDVDDDFDKIPALCESLFSGAQGGPENPDGLVFNSNFVAFYALKALQKMQIAIPRGLKLITFDNYPFAPYTSPSLSVVDIDVFELGVQSCNLLLDCLKKETEPQPIILSPTVIERESSRQA
jgi:DNA-binding LacI/PurR family transcriptional regulator